MQEVLTPLTIEGLEVTEKTQQQAVLGEDWSRTLALMMGKTVNGIAPQYCLSNGVPTTGPIAYDLFDMEYAFLQNSLMVTPFNGTGFDYFEAHSIDIWGILGVIDATPAGILSLIPRITAFRPATGYPASSICAMVRGVSVDLNYIDGDSINGYYYCVFGKIKEKFRAP